MKKEENKNVIDEIFKNVKDHLPIYTLIFIAIGSINNIIYYRIFGIDILGYMSLSEVPNLFIKDVITFTNVLIIYLLSILYIKFANNFAPPQRIKPKKLKNAIKIVIPLILYLSLMFIITRVSVLN